MSTEFYLHAIEGMTEQEAQFIRFQTVVWETWFASPKQWHYRPQELWAKDDRDLSRWKDGKLWDSDFEHVGHVHICHEMLMFINLQKGSLITSDLIEIMLNYRDISDQVFATEAAQSDMSYFYSTIDKQSFEQWLQKHLGRRLFPRVD